MPKTTPEHPGGWGKVHDDLVVAARDLAKIVPALPDRWQAMCDALPGQPGASDPSATRVTGSSTGAAGDPVTSRAAVDQAAARRHAREIRRHAFQLAALLGNYQTRCADDNQRAKTGGGSDGCVSCQRIKIDKDTGNPTKAGKGGQRWWQPIHRTVELADGRRAGLCQWCWRWWKYGHGDEPTGDYPPLGALLVHAAGDPVSKTGWYREHPPAKAAS